MHSDGQSDSDTTVSASQRGKMVPHAEESAALRVQSVFRGNEARGIAMRRRYAGGGRARRLVHPHASADARGYWE